MQAWPDIPEDVTNWFRSVFADANRRVSQRLANLPNIRETSLDDGLIEALIPDTAPTLLGSGAIVRMDTHNIGGLRRFGGPQWDYPMRGRWETADIAILVFVYRKNDPVAKKIGLLQSKRLFPTNNDVEDEDEIGFLYGMNAFLRRESQQASATLFRKFEFDESSIYGAIKAGSQQVEVIDKLNSEFGKAVYYLLYNAPTIPYSVQYPLESRIELDEVEIGCRVADADDIHATLSKLNNGASPTYSALLQSSSKRNWSLETWAADLLLTCKVGEQFDDDRDKRVRYFLERRSGPIGAAVAVSVTLPD